MTPGREQTPAPPPNPAQTGPVPPPAGPAGSRYGWFFGLLVVLIVGYITLNTAITKPHGSRGPDPGSSLPAFAVPLALGNLNGDADVATRAGQGEAGRVPACQERGPGILNSCQLTERGPVALGLFLPAGGCPRVMDELASLQRSFPGVQLAGVAIRGNRSDVRALVRKHGWTFPVGWDRDGAVFNLYQMAVCSQVTLADRGGRVDGHSLLGAPSLATLRARLAALAATDAARTGRGA